MDYQSSSCLGILMVTMPIQTGEVGHFLPGRDEYIETDIPMPTETQLTAYREVRAFAVDPEFKHEVDDAFLVERKKNGNLKITVVVAQGGRIPAHSTQFYDALVKGWSFYGDEASDGTVYDPMHGDEDLVARRLSLVEDEMRPGVAFTCTLSKNGDVKNQDIEYVKLKAHNHSHEEFGSLVATGEFSNYLEAVNRLRKKRGWRQMNIGNIIKSEHQQNPQEMIGKNMTAEFMILANYEMGEMMRNHNIPWVYRYFDGSDLQQIPEAGIESIDEQIEYVVQRARRALYSLDPKAHEDLGFDHYSHNTSPLRRAADMINHSILHYVMTGGDPNAIQLEPLQYWVDYLNDLIIKRADLLGSEY